MNKQEQEFYYKGLYEGERKNKQLWKILFISICVVAGLLIVMSWTYSIVEQSNAKIINTNNQKVDLTN